MMMRLLPPKISDEEFAKYIHVTDLEEAILLRDAGLLYVLEPPLYHKYGRYHLRRTNAHRLKEFKRGYRGRWSYTWKESWWSHRRASFYVRVEA